MYGKYFTFDNEASTDYNLMIGGFQRDDVPLAMNRELLKGTLNRYRNRVNHMGTQWSDVLEFTISFMKDPCNKSYQSDMIFTEDEVDAINTWLTSPDYPILFHMYDYDFEKDGSDNMVLIDNTKTTVNVEIQANDYSYVIYRISDGELVSTNITIVGNKTPPEPESIVQYDNYLSIAFDEDYIRSITKIYVGGVEYEESDTRSWLSTYAAGDTCENQYVKVINKSLILNKKYNYFGLFSNVEAETYHGDIIGLTATFTTDSPFAWTDTITKTFEVSDGDTITFDVQTSEKYREIYPVIKIKPVYTGGAGRSDIILHNNRDGYEIQMELQQAINVATTTLDCEHSKIYSASSSLSFEDLGITDTDYIYWPRLYNGTNSFTVSGDCVLTFEYREPRKVGAY